MPSKSPAQARLMAMVAHNPAAARRTGVPQSVGREFNMADKKTGILRKKRKKPPAAPPAAPPGMGPAGGPAGGGGGM
jgi:hypothetical protein